MGARYRRGMAHRVEWEWTGVHCELPLVTLLVARVYDVRSLTRVAGFEWGTGFYINPVPPEQAAAFLHDTEVDVSAAPKR